MTTPGPDTVAAAVAAARSVLATPAPLSALLDAVRFQVHYGATLTDHTSVMPGDLVETCTDDPCPALFAAARSVLATPTPLDVEDEAARIAVLLGDLMCRRTHGADNKRRPKVTCRRHRDHADWLSWLMVDEGLTIALRAALIEEARND